MTAFSDETFKMAGVGWSVEMASEFRSLAGLAGRGSRLGPFIHRSRVEWLQSREGIRLEIPWCALLAAFSGSV